MLSLTVFLNLLPGIKPLKARHLILEGLLLTSEQRKDIRMRDLNVFDTVLEVGPDAATAIIEAYQAGKLPMQKASLRPSSVPEAESYLADASRLREEIAERRRLERAVSDPSVLREADLSNYQLLDRVFFAAKGAGAGTLVLAGISVTKSLAGYSSNSGKTTGWRVSFSWTASDGQQRLIEKVPPEADNRRNDPERNWGLYD
ncbi:hypothetical protein NKI66_03500 [Mesorhizobium sp. M0518]|uniref:hypothetical protein n=1 Tax=Mesorhizobium sp. M0518 TaxID=2956956 RepID=UPI0033353014